MATLCASTRRCPAWLPTLFLYFLVCVSISPSAPSHCMFCSACFTFDWLSPRHLLRSYLVNFLALLYWFSSSSRGGKECPVRLSF